jgi:glycogen operon protein
VRLAGDQIGERDERGEPIVGDTLFAAFNAGDVPVTFALPVTAPGQVWESVLDTTSDDGPPGVLEGGGRCPVAAHAVVVFRTRPRAPAEPGVTPLQAEAIRHAAEAPRPRPLPTEHP